MPRGDRTGPSGMGPVTGRGMGYCAGFDRPGYMQPGYGAGMGLGRGYRGGGFGWRHMYYATGMPGWARYGIAPSLPPVPPRWTAADEATALREQAEMLQRSLEQIRQRLNELTPDAGEG